MGMMCTIDDFHLRANHYKEECSRLRGQIRDLESLFINMKICLRVNPTDDLICERSLVKWKKYILFHQ
jgi:hypothetical protein